MMFTIESLTNNGVGLDTVSTKIIEFNGQPLASCMSNEYMPVDTPVKVIDPALALIVPE